MLSHFLYKKKGLKPSKTVKFYKKLFFVLRLFLFFIFCYAHGFKSGV